MANRSRWMPPGHLPKHPKLYQQFFTSGWDCWKKRQKLGTMTCILNIFTDTSGVVLKTNRKRGQWLDRNMFQQNLKTSSNFKSTQLAIWNGKKLQNWVTIYHLPPIKGNSYWGHPLGLAPENSHHLPGDRRAKAPIAFPTKTDSTHLLPRKQRNHRETLEKAWEDKCQ